MTNEFRNLLRILTRERCCAGAYACMYAHEQHTRAHTHMPHAYLEFYPVQSKRVQEALQHIHDNEDREGHTREDGVPDNYRHRIGCQGCASLVWTGEEFATCLQHSSAQFKSQACARA